MSPLRRSAIEFGRFTYPQCAFGPQLMGGSDEPLHPAATERHAGRAPGLLCGSRGLRRPILTFDLAVSQDPCGRHAGIAARRLVSPARLAGRCLATLPGHSETSRAERLVCAG